MYRVFPACILLLSLRALVWAQASQGWIEGMVTAGSGSRPLEGVLITLTGIPDKTVVSTVSDVSGRYRFLALRPGTYDLESQKAGYTAASVLTVEVESGRASIVDFAMNPGGAPVSVEWQKRPSDLWATDFGSRFNALRLAVLPSAHNIWAVLETQAKSTITNTPHEGGFDTVTIALTGSLGSSWTQSTYRLDGINVTDPFETGKSLVYPDYASLQNLKTSAGLHDAGIGAPGASIDMTTRDSGQDFHFGAEGYFLGEPLQSSNLDARLRGFGFATDPHFHHFSEGQFQLGGGLPHTSRWSVFSSFGVQHLTRTIPDFSAVPATTVSSGLLRFDGRLGQHDQFTLTSTGQIVNNSNLGARSGLAPSATLRGHDRYEVVQGRWTRNRGSRLVLGVFGGFSHSSPTDTLLAGIFEANRTQLFTGEMAGAAPLESDSARSRFSVGAQGQAWRSFWRAQHQLDFGVDLEESKSTEERRVFGDYQQLYYPFDTPVEVVEYDTPSHSKQRLREFSLYLEDRLRVSGRIFVRAGLALDSSNAFLPPQQSGAGSFSPARLFGGKSSVVSWTTLAPRISISAPLFRRFGGPRISAGYSRYYHALPASYANYANPTSLGGRVYIWSDANHDGLFQRGEEGTLLRTFGGPYSSVDPGLKRPFTDEFAIGLDQQIGERFSVEVRGFRRDQTRLIEAVNTGVTPSNYAPLSIRDPGDDGIAGTGDDQALTVFNQDPLSLGKDRYLLTNPAGLRSRYKGIEIAVRRELPHHGFVSVSFAAYSAVGTTNPGNSEFENDPGVAGDLFDNPNNQLNATGRTFFDRAYVGKVASYVHLPFGFYSGSVIRYADGLPFGRKLIVAGLNQGPIYVMATPRGEPGGFRTQFYLIFDQRLARDFTIERFRLSAMLDVFNLLNSNRNLSEYDITGPLFPPRTPVGFQNPRVLRLGLRIIL